MRVKRDTKKKQIMLVIFVAVVMISSTFGVIFYGYNREQGKVVYNKISFYRVSDGWTAKIDKKNFIFNYLPPDVADIELDENILGRARNTFELDMTSDVNSSYAEEIALSQYQLENALNALNVYMRRGFTTDNNFSANVITCNTSTGYVPVIYFKDSNETKIGTENDCIIIKVKNGIDIFRAKDRLLYGILNVLG